MRRARAALGGWLAVVSLPVGALHQSPAAQMAAPCRVSGPGRTLPEAVRETSGLAFGRRSPGVLWTHNDSGNEPVLFALDTTGALVGQVRVSGATLVDWEDLAAGPCDTGACLFIGDIGDNRGQRDSITIYRVPEPGPRDRQTAPVTAFHARYPDGPQDAEALFLLPGGDLYLVTKGRHGAVGLYRLPRASQRPGTTARLERVRELMPRARRGPDMVTAAAASPDGRWVAIRSYRTLYLYSAAGLIGGGAVTPVRVDLRPLRERQGEAVALTEAGEVWFTSEAARRRDLPALTRLACALGS